ncbi:hypothetical protein [Streptomyces sp. NPDC052610]|uniref:hypothetical protein n=1 Tax=Streptomyces sp. NPDC052610 TaxID=3154952 RepID=UPI00341F6458
MRVATRTRALSRRARLGAQFVGAGLAAAVAVGLTASPASAAQVTPEIFDEGSGNTTCEEQLGDNYVTARKIDPVPETGGTFEFDPPFDNGSVTVTVTDTNDDDEPTVFNFAINGPYAAAAVIVKGADASNIYNYVENGFPNGIAADTELNAPLNNGTLPGISHIEFCIIESPYNGNGNGGGTA